MMEFLYMGGRGWFVWPSFAISLIGLAALTFLSWRRLRRAEAEVKRLEGKTP